MSEAKLYIATKAFILHKNKVLILKESAKYADGANAGKYDLPGGRLKPGERYDDALKREVREETGLDVTVGKPIAVSEWRPVIKGEHSQIVGVFFLCTTDTDKIKLSKDHDSSLWIHPKDHEKHAIIPTNLPAFHAFLDGD